MELAGDFREGPGSDFGQCLPHVRFPSDSEDRGLTPRRRKLAIREFAIGRLGLGVRFNLGATEGCDVFATLNKKRFRRVQRPMAVFKALHTIRGRSRENTMSNKLFAPALATLSLILSVTLASAQQFGTAEEAKAMLDRAIAALKSDGSTALRAISDAHNKQFHDRDLYVSCFNTSDGKFTAFPSPGMIGIDVRTFKLGDDPIGQRAFDAIQSTPEGTMATMEYNFPKSGKPALKQSLATRIGNQGCGVAYYK